MKRILLFILPILLIVAIGFTVFGVMQIRFTQDKLMDKIQKNTNESTVRVLIALIYVAHILLMIMIGLSS